MKILEWSDTQLIFKITETENWTTTPVDLTEYDKVVLSISLWWTIIDIEGEVDWQDTSKVTFDLFSEQTKNRCGGVQADIRWLKDEKKLRFNQNTIEWTILHSIKVPQWDVNG